MPLISLKKNNLSVRKCQFSQASATHLPSRRAVLETDGQRCPHDTSYWKRGCRGRHVSSCGGSGFSVSRRVTSTQSDSLDCKCSKGCPPPAFAFRFHSDLTYLVHGAPKRRDMKEWGRNAMEDSRKAVLMLQALQASEHFEIEAGRMRIEGLSPFHWPLNYQNPAVPP